MGVSPATTFASTSTARKSPTGPGQQGPARALSDILADRRPVDRGPLHQGPVPTCPVRAKCTTSRDGARNVGFPPGELHELQLRNRAEQREPDWHKRYAVRSGIEGTICAFAHGDGMRRCRYRGQAKAHLQHVLTAIAVNVERLSRG
ncbi:transposase [Nonomuraea sp. LP-02]|uniref:transposase n=1 Tax=Nonomuraea sp. LP-02 TaxID=3097960 RepID=UPI002E333D6E|nr:transposase [Nonomuraea sp. LP-02]MED7930483.1 transposase [Nonomuraea sp. LP-02]